MKPYDLAVVIGRFQPLHIAHEELIKNAFHQAEHVLVLAGSANESRTDKNPLTFVERRNILEIVFSKQLQNFSALPLDDYESDWDWALSVEEKVSRIALQIGAKKVCFVVCNKDQATKDSNHILNSLLYDIVYQPLLYELNATSIREALRKGVPVHELVSIPTSAKKYLDKVWKNITLGKVESTLPHKKKWYNRRPVKYLIEPFFWLMSLITS